MAKSTPNKPGVSAAKGRGRNKPAKVKTSGAPGHYTADSGIVRETTTKKPKSGKYSK